MSIFKFASTAFPETIYGGGLQKPACRSCWQWLVVLSILQVESNIKEAMCHSIVVKSSADEKVVYMVNNQDPAHMINISRVFILVGELDGNQSVIGTRS